MPQHEFVPSGFQLDGSTENCPSTEVRLSSQQKNNTFNFSFEALRPNLFRTTFTSRNHLLPPHPSAALPKADLAGIKTSASDPSTSSRRIEVGDVVANVDWSGAPLVSLAFADSGRSLHEDLPYRSYLADGNGIAHYTKYNRKTLHVGLGEKNAPMDLSNRKFILSATDCFGYDVYRTDPMYKHIPLLINATPQGCIGIFSTAHARGSYSIGSEMDGMWGHYKVYRQDYGGLEEYLIIGRTLKDIVRTYADLVGYPLLVPRWAFGYIAGGMKYSMLDEPRATDVLLAFAKKMKDEDIPCSGFQMSSGYTVAETEPKTRNVFTWNRHRFPDPKGFADEYHAQGIRLIANVKPYILANHPEYQKLVDAGALFTDSRSGKSATTRLWSAGGGESGVGGHIDFTSAAGYRFWYNGIRELKKVGIDCIWNDNNEYTIPDDEWQCGLDEASVIKTAGNANIKSVGFWGRALNTELMGKSSYEASLEVEPDKRPFVLTRSATAGTMRYCASSWSGDNVTSWESMKGANALSLMAGMCLLQCYGHDIGGFEGPQPSPELLVRWVQLGIYSPRFAINCYKTSPEDNSVGDVIEPWMYPETTPIVRAAIKRRYALIPYLYSLALESHMTATPPQRWTGWGCESDPEVWNNKILTDGETQYWLGDSLLIGGVYEPGVSISRVYLPKSKSDPDAQFLNLNAPYQYFSAGQWVDIDSTWTDSIPVLAKVGGAVPVGLDVQTVVSSEEQNPAKLPLDNYRAVELYPPRESSHGKTFVNRWYEDDGISPAPAKVSSFSVSYSCSDTEIQVTYAEDLRQGFVPAWKKLGVILPSGETREVIFNGQKLGSSTADERQRVHFEGSSVR